MGLKSVKACHHLPPPPTGLTPTFLLLKGEQSLPPLQRKPAPLDDGEHSSDQLVTAGTLLTGLLFRSHKPHFCFWDVSADLERQDLVSSCGPSLLKEKEEKEENADRECLLQAAGLLPLGRQLFLTSTQLLQEVLLPPGELLEFRLHGGNRGNDVRCRFS